MNTTKTMVFIILFSMLAPMSLSEPVIEVAYASTSTIEEGFLIDGAAGFLKKEANEDLWKFVPDEVIEAPKNMTFPAGGLIEMLPCSVLEQMTELAGDKNEIHVQLWALFTEYKSKNFLFSVYFLPMQDEIVQPKPEVPEETPEQAVEVEPAQDEPEEDSIIPEDILKQIKSNKTPDLKKFQQIAKVTGDTNLIGRAGYLSEGSPVHTFRPDALGMKINKNQFVLLPNSILASTEEVLALTPGKQRHNISGLVTTYKGKTYMLLRRADRTFSHGNFTP